MPGQSVRPVPISLHPVSSFPHIIIVFSVQSSLKTVIVSVRKLISLV